MYLLHTNVSKTNDANINQSGYEEVKHVDCIYSVQVFLTDFLTLVYYQTGHK